MTASLSRRLLVAGAVACAFASRPALALTERIVADPVTGLAIGGNDPVSYFVDGAPREGRRMLELGWGGTTWRFVNEGNRAAFEHAPHVYSPRFGGYSPCRIAEGYAVQGNPAIWAIHGERLYFFHSRDDRAAWVRDPDQVVAQAADVWPMLERRLVAR